jgi:hypothetical protein
MQGQAAMKSRGLIESWSGKKNVSYNDRPDAVRLMIRHNRDIAEGEQRFRHIAGLFLETAEGERFKLPFKSLAGGKAMCEHVRNGGRPYDIRGAHISQVVNEITVLSRFNRARPDVIFESDTILESARTHEAVLRETLKKMGSRRGYNSYFESWNPADITDADLMIEEVRNLMNTQEVDSRIEEALPILAKLSGTRVTEADIFESWANNLVDKI